MTLDFHPVGGAWLVAIIATVLVLLLGVGPRHVRLSWGQSLILRTLRLLVIVLVLLAMLRPTLKYTTTRTIETTLLVLVDGSRSMQVVDSMGGASRWQAVKQVLGDAAADFQKLAETSQVKFVEFTSETRSLESPDQAPKLADQPQGDQSAIGAALSAALDSDERLLGVLLLSDGAQRAVPPNDAVPQLVVRQLAAEGVPLFTFTFGQPGGSERADVAIEDLAISDTLFAGAPANVSGQLRAEGYVNQVLKVQLEWEQTDGTMATVATQPVTPVEASARVPLSLAHVPTEPGEYKVTLRALPPEGEVVTSNNEASTFVTVRKGGVRILYLSGAKQIGGRAGGREQRFVRSTLAMSPDLLVTHRVIDYLPGEIDLRRDLEPDRWDVVVLDDVDAMGLGATSWQALADIVDNGTGLLMSGGYHSFGPGGFRVNPIARALPIEIGVAERQQFGEALREDVQLAGPVVIEPTQLGLAHPVLQIAPRNELASAWKALPPLDGANLLPASQLKPLAQVLAQTPAPTSHPLLVAGQSGNGRVMAFAGDSTWRWQMQGHPDAFRRFWRQMMLWLARKETRESGTAWIELASRRVPRGGTLELEAGYDQPDGEAPPADTQVTVTISAPDGKTSTVTMLPAGEDRRGGNFASTAVAGDYLARVTVTQGGTQVAEASARFLVPNDDMELDRPAAEPALMAQLATATADAGGLALAPEELPRLVSELAARPVETTEEVFARVTYWDTWPFFLTFVCVIVSEWWLRKSWGLV